MSSSTKKASRGQNNVLKAGQPVTILKSKVRLPPLENQLENLVEESDAASSQIQRSSSSSSASTISNDGEISHTQGEVDVAGKKDYNFVFLTDLNNSDNMSSTGLANQLVKGASTVLSELFEADEKLKQYFFEMVVMAYRMQINGADNLKKFVELTWKVYSLV